MAGREREEDETDLLQPLKLFSYVLPIISSLRREGLWDLGFGKFQRPEESWDETIAFKEGKPSDLELDELAGKIAAKWEMVGIHLGISQDVLEGIDANAKDKPSQMLLRWRNTTTSATPYQDLYYSLCHDRVGLNAVAKGFCLRDFPFSHWIQEECLGAGNFGKVYKCHHEHHGILAVKIVKMEPQYTETQEEVKALNNEIRILKDLRHERIVSYYGSEQKDDHLHLFMDFMPGGSLSDYIKKNGVLSESSSKGCTKQMLEGVYFLHSQNIIHRDIKGSNVLLDGEGNVKLADFGLSKMIQKVGSKTNLISHCGTPYWMAPEIFRSVGYGRKADIWSLGCTVVEMLTGKPPLGDREPTAAIFRIGSGPIEPTLPWSVSQDAREFVKAALTWKPEERPWSHELLSYTFVSNWYKPLKLFRTSSKTVQE